MYNTCVPLEWHVLYSLGIIIIRSTAKVYTYKGNQIQHYNDSVTICKATAGGTHIK